jgi:hypothetical protein
MINKDRDINAIFIHAGNEFVGSSQFGFGVGVDDSEAGVIINILTAVFLYL